MNKKDKLNLFHRKDILLRAAYDLLTQCKRSQIVLNVEEITIRYDDVDNDGNCLRDDIAAELGLSGEEDPILTQEDIEIQEYEQNGNKDFNGVHLES